MPGKRLYHREGLQAVLLSMQLLECSVRGCIVRSQNMRMIMQAYRLLTRVKRLWKGQGGPLTMPATAGS
ncbi:unknown [Clostridium sp. CAG:299]|nr:unknown [Clostridium sp. CAG:299]